MASLNSYALENDPGIAYFEKVLLTIRKQKIEDIKQNHHVESNHRLKTLTEILAPYFILIH